MQKREQQDDGPWDEFENVQHPIDNQEEDLKSPIGKKEMQNQLQESNTQMSFKV